MDCAPCVLQLASLCGVALVLWFMVHSYLWRNSLRNIPGPRSKSFITGTPACTFATVRRFIYKRCRQYGPVLRTRVHIIPARHRGVLQVQGAEVEWHPRGTQHVTPKPRHSADAHVQRPILYIYDSKALHAVLVRDSDSFEQSGRLIR